jgi:hypothetical protein
MTRILPRLALAVLAPTGALLAQDVVSARAGLIHYLEGKVYLQEQELDQTPSTKLFSRFPEVKENERLRTAMGRAEILLSPGAVLRIGEDSQIRMISNRLIDTRLELESGSAVVDVSELQKENSITILVKDATVQLRKSGLYRLSASPATLMVYDGQAEVVADDVRRTVKKGTSLTMEGAITASKFDTERGDSLLRWSLRRSGYLAMANISAAKSLRDSGYAWSGGWQWNPFFGMFTFIPARGIACNGFTGMCFYSPQRIYSVFYRPVMPSYNAGFGGGGVRYGWDGAGGYAVASQRTYGGYPAGAAAGASGAPAAAAAPVGDAGGVRGAEGAVGRGSAGGRGQ